MKNKQKVIGLLGGMGPSASVFMHKTLVDLSSRHFGALEGHEFPEIIHNSIPIEDFISDESKKRRALVVLKNRVERLSSLGTIGVFGIACNTAHIFLPELQKITTIPFVSMIEEVAKTVSSDILVIGLLATPATIRSGIYHKALEEKGKRIVTPNVKEMVVIESIIRKIISGRILKKDGERLVVITNSLKRQGAQGIILGCTELPLVFPDSCFLPVFNSVEILAMSLLKKVFRRGDGGKEE